MIDRVDPVPVLIPVHTPPTTNTPIPTGSTGTYQYQYQLLLLLHDYGAHGLFREDDTTRNSQQNKMTRDNTILKDTNFVESRQLIRYSQTSILPLHCYCNRLLPIVIPYSPSPFASHTQTNTHTRSRLS